MDDRREREADSSAADFAAEAGGPWPLRLPLSPTRGERGLGGEWGGERPHRPRESRDGKQENGVTPEELDFVRQYDADAITLEESQRRMQAMVDRMPNEDQGSFVERWYQEVFRDGDESLHGQFAVNQSDVPALSADRRPDFVEDLGETARIRELKSHSGALGTRDVAELEDYIRIAQSRHAVDVGGAEPVRISEVCLTMSNPSGARASRAEIGDLFEAAAEANVPFSVEVLVDGESRVFQTFDEFSAAFPESAR